MANPFLGPLLLYIAIPLYYGPQQWANLFRFTSRICRTNATFINQSRLLVLSNPMPSLVIWAVSQHMFIATLWTAGYLPTFGTFSKTLLECNLLVTLKLFVDWSNVRFLKFVVKHHNLSVTIGYKNLYPNFVTNHHNVSSLLHSEPFDVNFWLPFATLRAMP